MKITYLKVYIFDDTLIQLSNDVFDMIMSPEAARELASVLVQAYVEIVEAQDEQ